MSELKASHHSQHAERVSTRVRMLSKLNRYRNLLFGKWWIPVLGISIGVGVQLALHTYEAPSYMSVGRMIVNIKLAIPEGSVYTEELSNFLGTQAALMQSGVVVNRAHARVIEKTAGGEPEKVNVKVSILPKTTIFVLTATGASPEYTRNYLQACMEEYVALKKEMREQTSDTTLAGLTEEVMRLQKDLRVADDQLAAFQSSNSVTVLQEQGNSAAAFLIQLNQKLAMLKSEYELLQVLTLDQNLERQQQGASTLSLSEATRSGGQAAETDYLRAKQAILLLKAEQQELSEYLREKHPKMIALTEEISRRERLLEIYREQGKEQLESRKNSLALQITNLEKDVREWDAKALDTSRKQAEFQRLKASATRIQALYDRLLATMQTLDVNKEISPESVTIMEKASSALQDRPPISKRIAIGSVLGLAAAFLILLLLDRMDDRISSLSELQDVFEETVLTQVPREKSLEKDVKRTLIAAHDDRHGLVEAYRNLRSSLTFMGDGQTPAARSILVTSSIPGDGKSFTASNLAISLAHAGKNVLLIDGDMRKGVLHERLGLESGPGFSEVLRKQVNWMEAVLPTHEAKLSLLPRGEPSSHSSELLLTPLAQSVLSEVRAQYDYVIVDSAPVMAADDVACLAPHVDGIVFVLRAEHTSARVAQASLDALYQRRANVLGIVFNAVRPTGADYYYYAYRGSYYHLPSEEKKRPAAVARKQA